MVSYLLTQQAKQSWWCSLHNNALAIYFIEINQEVLYCTLSADTRSCFLSPTSCHPMGPLSQSAQIRYLTVWFTFLEKPTFSKWNMSSTNQNWVTWSPDGSEPMLYLSVMLGKKGCTEEREKVAASDDL